MPAARALIRLRPRALAVAAALLPAAAASAQLHDSDIILAVEAGRLTTSALGPGAAPAPQSVFAGAFGAADTTNDPGFDSAPGAFLASAALGFDILGPLRAWDGADFDAVAQPRLRVRSGRTLERFTPPAPGEVPGYSLSVDADTGQWHRHLNFTLFSQATPPLVPAEAGVYLFSLRIWATQPDVAPTPPVHIVFLQGDDTAAHDAALAWAAANLGTPAGPAPCNVADIASIGGFPPPDGELTVDDYTSFINAFAADELLADIVSIGGFPPPDGQLTVDDYTSFINAFAQGC